MRPSFLACYLPARFGAQPTSKAAFRPFQPFKESISTSKPEIARAIRKEVRTGNIDEGYRLFTKANPRRSYRSNNTEQQAKPSRFLAHVLLHALHRSGYQSKATSFIQACLNNGIRIHDSTFHLLFFKPSLTSNAVILGKAIPSRSHSAKVALSLFNTARSSGHGYSAWMIDRFLHKLLLHGEVLTAALLFVAIVKEWSANNSMKPVARQCIPEDQTYDSRSLPDVQSLSTGVRRKPRTSPLTTQWMHQIATEIENGQRPRDANTTHSIQALSVLVDLLAEGCSFIPAKWRLLKIMYSTPPEILPDKTEYERFHGILLNLCDPFTNPHRLDIASYHTLLQYALRERLSVDLGAKVVKALCQWHEPTPVTYNILLRELVRLKDLPTAKAIGRLLTPGSYSLDLPLSTSSELKPNRQQMVDELSKHPVPLPDEYTAIASMALAIATGNPGDACKVFTHLFPTLEQANWGAGSGRHSVVRARKMSPHFWGMAIHAAAKAKQIKLAMRMCRFLTKAESERGKEISLYSLQAYTSYFQLFFAKFWSIHQNAQSLDAEVDTTRNRGIIWALFMQYNQLLMAMQTILRSLGDRRRRNPNFKADQRLIDILLSLAKCIQEIGRYLPHLACRVANLGQTRRYFENRVYRCRGNTVVGTIRTVLRRYGGLTTKQLRVRRRAASATESLPSPHLSKQPNPHTKRGSGVLQKTRSGFKIHYSSRDRRSVSTQKQ